MRCILILIDSLNRHDLPCYCPETARARADALGAFCRDSVQFDGHYVGSAPCMPARRDIFTGRLNFLERPWGGLEPYDRTFVTELRRHGIFTHITTDHLHYFEIGGENYCQQFDTWNFERGQECDPWISRVRGVPGPSSYFGKINGHNLANRLGYSEEAEYPTPRTFASACQWLRENQDATDYFLMVEAFDPHEPFDTPQSYLKAYETAYAGPHFDWPSYRAREEETDEAIEHLQKKYAATLTMMDTWFGKLVQTMKDTGVYDDSLIIVTSDHGHMLGEHGFCGKGFMHMYDELARLPLLIRFPGGWHAGEHITALTQNIDLMPTILEFFGIESDAPIEGKSLYPLLNGSRNRLRDACLYGYFGKTVNVCDGRYTYFRAPVSPDNQPCYMYGAMPTTFLRYLTVDPSQITMGRFLPYTDFPVYRIRYEPGGPFFGTGGPLTYQQDSVLFDTESDPKQETPLNNPTLEYRMIRLLLDQMESAQAPREQLTRLGLGG